MFLVLVLKPDLRLVPTLLVLNHMAVVVEWTKYLRRRRPGEVALISMVLNFYICKVSLIKPRVIGGLNEIRLCRDLWTEE